MKDMKKNRLDRRVVEIGVGVLLLGVLVTMIIYDIKKEIRESELTKTREEPAYQITVLWGEKRWFHYDPNLAQSYPDRIQLYIEALKRDQRIGYFLGLSQAVIEIESKGYEIKIVSASLRYDDVQAIGVIAERKK